MPQKEILQRHADRIVGGVDNAIKAGLDPDIVDYARFSNQHNESQLTQDMWLVLLGLKPVASFVLQGVGYFRLEDDRHVIDFIEAPEGYTTLISGFVDCIWNPRLVSNILAKYPNNQINPFDVEEFPRFIERICHGAKDPQDTYLAGLLHGIPSKAASDFIKYRPAITSTVQLVWEEASRMGIETVFPMPSDDYLHSPVETRDEFARLAQATGIVGPKDLLNYVRYVRPSQTPGSPYMTSGAELSRHEKRLTKLYELSGLEAKLDKLLDKYLVDEATD